MADLILFHGHACDGLVRGAYALRALVDVATEDGVVDRTGLLVVSTSSSCLGDVAAYRTGAGPGPVPLGSTTPGGRLHRGPVVHRGNVGGSGGA
ncbi:MAG: FmdE family protein, partial [Actinomycetes bacterium]